jgi:flagellar protein FlgJ
MNVLRATSAVAASTEATPDRLRKAAARLEGAFVEQLFKVMRETVPQDGALETGNGEEIFTSLFDQHVADQAPAHWNHGLAAAILRALGRPARDETTAGVPAPVVPRSGLDTDLVSPYSPTLEHH